MKAVDIYIDGYIGQGDFFADGFTLKTLRDKLNESKDATEINVHINSGGGSVTEGFAIHDYLKNSGKKVNTIVEGMCGSIATVIAQANANGGTRSMHKNSDYFVHNPYVDMWGQTLDADAANILAHELKTAEEKIVNLYVGATGQTAEAIREKMDSKTTLSADDAKALGFVDEIIGEDVQAHYRYRIAAFVKQKSENKMEGTILNKLEAAAKKVQKLLNANKLNMSTSTDKGALYFDGELAVDTAVFSDEAMATPATDGDYMEGENKISVTGGKVTAITDTTQAAADAEKLKAENETLKTKIAENEAAITAAKQEATDAQAKLTEVTNGLNEVQTELLAMKKEFSTGAGDFKPGAQNFNRGGEGNKSWQEQVVELRKAKEETKK